MVKSEEMFSSSPTNGSQDQVLHEMEALQDEIGDIHKQLMML